MKVAVLTANLGKFDKEVENVPQQVSGNVQVTFHRFTDENFPPIEGLTPRMQYRIPKTFGWQMFPGYDYYIWLDGSFSMQHEGSVEWFLEQVLGYDMALFKHPHRNTIKEEVDHIEDHLKKGKPYITSRYKGGLHKEQYAMIKADPNYTDNILYTSTAFVYSNNDYVQEALKDWWNDGARYFTCDQVVLPYIVYKHKLSVYAIEKDQYKIPYLTLTSKHK